MDLTTIVAKDKLGDIAKGRYSKSQVENIFKKAMTVAALESEHSAFEYAILTMCQVLHYEFGFGKTRLSRMVEKTQPMLDGFDAKAYDMDDMRQALREDAGFDLDFVYRKGGC